MARAKKLKKLTKSGLKPETRKSVAAILLLGIAAILVLASMGSAGPLGNFIFRGLTRLFGLGYYLIPAISFLVALLFLFTLEKKFLSTSIIGAAIFIILGMGLIDVVLPERGGFVGMTVGLIEIPFGTTAGIVLLSTFLIISLLVTFNASIGLRLEKLALLRKKKEEPLVITNEAPEIEDEPQEPEQELEQEKAEKTPQEESRPDNRLDTVIAKPAAATAKIKRRPVPVLKDYIPPPLNLLKSATEKPTSGDLRANANIIKRTMESFGIAVEMGEISIGPKVTRYTLKPAQGIKLARITALHQDLALSLAAHPIRIEAPIPGKSLVGIEVPNKAAAIVRLGSLMAYPEFANSGLLTFPLGRDVSGEPIFADIEKMPHLLIAGSTGSGKSIAIHSILISLLYKNSPETLRMVLIDPKRVELSVYDDLPHLVSPVITQAKKTIGVFRWAIGEMEDRYEKLLKAGSRDINSYNKNGHGTMPYLLIVIDELADLMASYGREIEGSIVRLAQMARATGIHLVVSTQRPSVEIITGLIKANITSRIALQVASQVDSRTILDAAGAEKLLGGGDLLFISGELSKPRRIQGAYLGEDEIKKVTSFVVKNNRVQEDESIEEEFEQMGDERTALFDDYLESGEEDELFEEAVTLVRQAKKASASLLQRRLKIGYARAARLLDIMEDKGIVGPGEGAKPREVYLE